MPILTQTAIDRASRADRTTASVIGTIIGFRPESHDSGSIIYKVNGREYKCSISGLGHSGLMIGAPYVIYYNPSKPEEISDDPNKISLKKDVKDLAVLECIVLVLCGIVVFIKYKFIERRNELYKPTIAVLCEKAQETREGK